MCYLFKYFKKGMRLRMFAELKRELEPLGKRIEDLRVSL